MGTISMEFIRLVNRREICSTFKAFLIRRPKVIFLHNSAFGKGRGFKNEDTEACQTFEVVYPLQIRRNYLMKYKSPLLQKMVAKNFQQQSMFSNPLPDDWDDSDYDQVEKISLSMVENFKMYLEIVKVSLRNVQDRSWWTKFISCPVTQDMVGK